MSKFIQPWIITVIISFISQILYQYNYRQPPFFMYITGSLIDTVKYNNLLKSERGGPFHHTNIYFIHSWCYVISSIVFKYYQHIRCEFPSFVDNNSILCFLTMAQIYVLCLPFIIWCWIYFYFSSLISEIIFLFYISFSL
jgi:hypothetical protein